uniref:Uncharacterized protein n=1 Tax=Glossina pallidipes TaxID=7398 RepID=A0A1B0AHR9_GLOPL
MHQQLNANQRQQQRRICLKLKTTSSVAIKCRLSISILATLNVSTRDDGPATETPLDSQFSGIQISIGLYFK